MFLNADGRVTETGQISRCPAGCSRWLWQLLWRADISVALCGLVTVKVSGE